LKKCSYGGEIKSQVSNLSLQIARKVLREESFIKEAQTASGKKVEAKLN
jgi:hypothetical protein